MNFDVRLLYGMRIQSATTSLVQQTKKKNLRGVCGMCLLRSRAICTALERALNDIRDNFICITRKEVDLSVLNQHTVHVINILL